MDGLRVEHPLMITNIKIGFVAGEVGKFGMTAGADCLGRCTA